MKRSRRRRDKEDAYDLQFVEARRHEPRESFEEVERRLSLKEREHDPAFIESIALARKQAAEGKTISLDDLKRELGIE